ncbi:phage gp6-like head-tail connector protein [Dickeya oryzae]|uniref:Phage gp6-like head-tail connector protein n=1 Tax=Dickeya oryzae TaxID=1240404 RepID=A0ABS5B6V7_9GAMM|nr:head-tail connector protein [Dickeya oryzae]MBP2856177.1 phage gp6-like head-tail connector protein [Dickeya oryzae]
MVPTIEELRIQCRIDSDDATEDQVLTLYCASARHRAENYINRTLHDDFVPENDSEGLVISPDIKLALMLAVGFWYENREAQSLPDGFFSMLEPYRFIPL